jgi:hypothetical protein
MVFNVLFLDKGYDKCNREKAYRVFLKGFKHHLVLHAACYRFLNTDTKHDNKEPCSCKIWQHGQKRYRNIMQPVLTI